MTITAAAAFTFAALALAVPQDTKTGSDLLLNPSAETGNKRPDAWEKGNPVPGVQYLWPEGEAADGKRCLSLRKEVERFLPIAAWQQQVAHDGRARKLHFGGLVKAAQAQKAILDVGFVAGDGEWTHAWAAYIGAREVDGAAADHGWRWYSGVVAVPAGTTVLQFGLQIYGPGQVWFDQLRAVFVDEATPVTDAASASAQPGDAWGSLPTPAAAAPSAAAAGDKPRTIDGDEQRSFFVISPRGKARDAGHGLIVVLPGGDGSADFHPFVRNIAQQALPADYVLAQAIAPKHKGAKELVWPKRKDRVREVKHATEDFVQAIIGVVQKEHRIDGQRVFLLGWSSGGPPTYATAVDAKSPVRGALVAMSVFHRDDLGKLDGAKARAFYVLHSPTDFIAMDFPKSAVRELGRAGAKTVLVEYEGGHGWHGDVFGEIGKGVRWLEENVGKGR